MFFSIGYFTSGFLFDFQFLVNGAVLFGVAVDAAVTVDTFNPSVFASYVS